MINLNHVDFTYSGSHTRALKDVTAIIEPGIHLLLGENGAGKTTLLRMIAGLLRPQSGNCTIDGTDTCLRKPSTLSILSLLESGQTVPQSNIKEMAKRMACFYPSFNADILESCMNAFEISYTQPFTSMSLGQRQKALLCYTLSLQTDIILLDEPTNGLDIDSKAELQRMLVANLPDNATVIISTHTVADLFAIYDGVIVMKQNSLLCNTDNDSLLDRFGFVSGSTAHPQALYSEPVAGRVLSLIPADDTLPSTAVDYRLLYRALHSKNADNVAEIINKI